MRTIDINERDQDERSGLHAFIMTLRPRRSADPRVAYVFCGVLAFIWLCAGLFFVAYGGWPVMGFFGAEFIFIAGMVHVFIRRTEVVETVEITPAEVIVTRRDMGRQEVKSFPAYWARAHYAGSSMSSAALEIRSHGEGIEIGRFLSAAEKDRTAWKLNDALRRLKSAQPE